LIKAQREQHALQLILAPLTKGEARATRTAAEPVACSRRTRHEQRAPRQNCWPSYAAQGASRARCSRIAGLLMKSEARTERAAAEPAAGPRRTRCEQSALQRNCWHARENQGPIKAPCSRTSGLLTEDEMRSRCVCVCVYLCVNSCACVCVIMCE